MLNKFKDTNDAWFAQHKWTFLIIFPSCIFDIATLELRGNWLACHCVYLLHDIQGQKIINKKLRQDFLWGFVCTKFLSVFLSFLVPFPSWVQFNSFLRNRPFKTWAPLFSSCRHKFMSVYLWFYVNICIRAYLNVSCLNKDNQRADSMET